MKDTKKSTTNVYLVSFMVVIYMTFK